MKCPFNKANNMCFAVHNASNQCTTECILHKLLETLSTMKSIDAKMAKPEIDIAPFEQIVANMVKSIPQPDLTPIMDKIQIKDYSEDISKLKKAVAILATDIVEIKDIVQKVQVGEIEETITKALADTKISQSLEKSVEHLVGIVSALKEKVPETII